MGSLTQTVTLSATNVNLTSIGLVDWADWDGTNSALTATDFKSGAGHTIANPTLIGGAVQAYTGDARTKNWTNGTNTGTSSNNGGEFNNGGATGNGFQIVLPADTNTRTVWVYIGGFDLGTPATVTCSLSDGSASPQTDSTTLTGSAGTSVDGLVKLVYAANSASQSLTLQFKINANTGNVTIQAVAIQSSTASGVSGSAAIAEGADIVAGTGVTTIVGTAAITEGADTVSASGTTSVTGTAAITEGADTVAGTGVTTIVGTAAITEGTDTVAGTGVTTIVGTAAIIEGTDTVAASGTSGSAVNGTAAITEGADTVSAAGTTTIVATAAIVEGADTVAGSGTTTIVGIAAILEGGDIVVASGAVGTVTGTAAILEGQDQVSANGSGGLQTNAGRHAKRYGVMDGWRLLLFNTKADADAFKTAAKQAKSPAKALKRIRTVEPVQVINIPELKRSLPPPQAARVDQMIREKRFDQVARLPTIADQYAAEAKQRAEVDEISHVVQAHRQASIEHAQGIHQALKVLHEIRKLRKSP